MRGAAGGRILRNGCDWPTERAPLAVFVEDAEGRRVSVHVTYETPGRRPVLEIHAGTARLRFRPAEARRIARLATDRERHPLGGTR